METADPETAPGLLAEAARQLASLPAQDSCAAPFTLADAVNAPLASLEDKRKKDIVTRDKKGHKAIVPTPENTRGALIGEEDEKSTFWLFAEVDPWARSYACSLPHRPQVADGAIS